LALFGLGTAGFGFLSSRALEFPPNLGFAAPYRFNVFVAGPGEAFGV